MIVHALAHEATNKRMQLALLIALIHTDKRCNNIAGQKWPLTTTTTIATTIAATIAATMTRITQRVVALTSRKRKR